MKTVIEETAIELAAAVYDETRKRGYQVKYKNQRAYVKANWEKYIPRAIDVLTQMLHGNYPQEMKDTIYDALVHRASTRPKINGLPEFDPKFFQ